MQREDIKLYVAGRLKMMRKIKGFTLEKVAKKIGVSRKQVQNYESCNCAISVVRLYQLARLFGVTLDFFVDGIDGKAKILSNDELRRVSKLYNIKDMEVRKSIVNLIEGL